MPATDKNNGDTEDDFAFSLETCLKLEGIEPTFPFQVRPFADYAVGQKQPLEPTKSSRK